mgnify:FL=1
MKEVIIDGVRYVPAPAAPRGKTLNAALEHRFNSDAGNALTVRDYLHALLSKLWAEGEGFSGKRPFGNSGWEYEMYKPLIAGGFIKGKLDADGYVEDFDKDEAEPYVFDLISAAFYGVKR